MRLDPMDLHSREGGASNKAKLHSGSLTHSCRPSCPAVDYRDRSTDCARHSCAKCQRHLPVKPKTAAPFYSRQPITSNVPPRSAHYHITFDFRLIYLRMLYQLTERLSLSSRLIGHSYVHNGPLIRISDVQKICCLPLPAAPCHFSAPIQLESMSLIHHCSLQDLFKLRRSRKANRSANVLPLRIPFG